MKKTYVYDPASGKMVERPPRNQIAFLRRSFPKTETFISIGSPQGDRTLIRSDRPLTDWEEKEHLNRVYDRAEEMAETQLSRSECVHFQEQLQQFRNFLDL
jgi:hypothetical protein